ncbi:hypothetical protein LJC49_06615, partial [Ruminococcaceae bacterium OttesenSCG-928-I18]|nr:hypothetical protein [Ruminococcaceae bacterium OttesenSCG-928-I18]
DYDDGMLFGEQNIDGKWYYFETGADGAEPYGFSSSGIDHKAQPGNMATGIWQMGRDDGRVVFFDPEKGHMQFGECYWEFSQYWDPWFYADPASGALQSGFVTLPDGRQVYYHEEEYFMLLGRSILAGYTYIFDDENGQLLYTNDPRGVAADAKGVVEDRPIGDPNERYENGNWYYYRDGQRVLGWAELSDGRTVYYDENGMVYGLQEINGYTFYFDNDTGEMLTGITLAQWYEPIYSYMAGAFMYFDRTYGLQTGEVKVDDLWFYFYDASHGVQIPALQYTVRGEMITGFVTYPDGRTVYYDPYCGDMRFGEFCDYWDSWWYADPGTGQIAYRFTQLPDGRLVYYDYDKGMLTGTHQLGSYIYDFGPNGNLEATNDPALL